MCRIFVSLVFSLTSAASSASPWCMAKLTSDKRNTFNTSELAYLIRTDLAGMSSQRELRRDYYRGNAKMLSLSIFIKEGTNFVGRGIALNISGMSEQETYRLHETLLMDLRYLIPDSQIYAVTVPARDFRISTGLRHAMTKEEAGALFLAMVSILARRLSSYWVVDSVGQPEYSGAL